MQTYEIDPDRTRLSFAVRGLLPMRGAFTRAAGTVTVDERGIPRALEVTIDARSLRTGLAARDLHLCTAAFLNVRRYPTITYSADHIERMGPDRYIVRGLLRLHGREHLVTLEVTPEADDGPDGARRARATGVLPRAAFGIPRNPVLRALMLPLIGDKIAVTADVRAALERERPAAASLSVARPHERPVFDKVS